MHMSTGQLIHSVWPDPSLKMLTVYKIVSFLIIEKIEINKTNKCRWIVLAQQWEIEQSQRDKQEWKCPWQRVKRRLESLFMYLVNLVSHWKISLENLRIKSYDKSYHQKVGKLLNRVFCPFSKKLGFFHFFVVWLVM